MTPGRSPRRVVTGSGVDVSLLTARLAASEAEVTALRTELDETSRGLVALYAELTDHQEQLELARTEADHANEAKARFLANMSHEIRSPLNAVTGFISLLLDTDLSPEQAEYADTVQAAGHHLRDLVDDILDLSKIESGHLELEGIPFDVVTCVEDAVGLVALSAEEKELPLAALFGPDIPARVIGDPVRLRQILVNLLSNAVKFTAGGAVTVEVTVVADDPATAAADGHRQLAFRVRDSGIGISGDAVDRLFAPFIQAEVSTTRTFGGTGLGLAICRELAERMGGGITLESALGVGSTFTCTIPVRQAEPDTAPGTPLRDIQILVVHDSDVVVEAIRRHLSGWGAEVVTAATAAEAIRRAHEWPAAAVALVHVRHADLLAGWAESPAGRSLAVVALMPVASRRSLAGGSDQTRATLSVPVRRALLRNAVLAALGRPPDIPDPPAATSPAITSPAVAGTLRILIAEDNAVNQRAATLILDRLGHHLDVVGDGEQAVAASLAGDYDLVLMDVQMPRVDGLEATRRIRLAHPGRRPRIVAVTASATGEIRQACLAAGMDDFVSKPFEPADLARIAAATPRRPEPGPVADGRPAHPGPARHTPAPAAPPEPPEPPPEPPAVPPARARTVLYVDDDPVMVRLVQRMLAREPAVTVLTAAGGDIALELATTGQPDVILLDLNLGGMTGEALLMRLQAAAATRSIPVVIVSGDATPATMQRLTGLGAVDYLAKPFDAAQLRTVLAAIPSRGTAAGIHP